MKIMSIIEILLGIAFAIIFYNLIHHYLVEIPNHKRQLVVKHKLDRIVPIILKSLETDRLIPKRTNYVMDSKPLSKIWGRDIFAYEYIIKLNFLNHKRLIRFRNRFNDTLTSYCKSHQITTKSGMSLYLVADVWNYHQLTHLDVACVYNSATIDYLKDIHRLK